MRKIAIAAAVSLGLSGVTNVSHALGLGEIEMYSALNQTLDAEIAILSASEAELQQMDVRLAPASAFARAGLVQSPVLSSVDFAVDRRPDGKAVVKVTSDSPVLEPFLNFLIEVDSPGSVKLVREYTVLLNPATFTGGEENSGRSDSVAAGASDVFVNTDNDATGVQIDITDAISGNLAASGEDSIVSGSEVVFSETQVDSFAEVDNSAATLPDTLFIPDDQVISGSNEGTTVVDSNGQVISLVQELNTTPQFDNSSGIAGEAIDLTDLDGDSGNAIFTSEFESSQGELIAGEELRGLVGDVEPASPVVILEESTTSDLVVSDLSGNDADAQGGAGDLIDLSGLIDDSETVVVEAPIATGSATNIELSGNTYNVRSQDTLWSISNAQKAPGVITHQMVVALVEANPQAFIGGNMNRMISGAVLQIPTQASQRSVDRDSAVAIVQSWTRGNAPARSATGSSRNIQPATVYEEAETLVDNSSLSTDLNSNLDEVNQRYEEVQTEIATGTVARDELQGRVDNLTDNMEEMKSLITVRENELNQLQDEVLAAESNAAAIDAQISQLSNASESVAAVQQGLNEELQQAQSAIAKRADVEKNLATAEAEAQSIRLSSEEDALRSQLAALELEKRDLEATSQLEKAALVREAEAEKQRLMVQARAERERILAELEVEKARISSEAELEIARVKADANTENQRLLSEAQAETEQMKAQLERMEAEKTRMMEESVEVAQMEPETTAAAQSGEPSRVKDRLAQLQQEGGDKAADMQASISKTVDTDAMKLDTDAMKLDTDVMKPDVDKDAEGMVGDAVSGMTDAGKSMAAGGAAAVGGLLGFAPLQEMVGNRKTVLAAGAGLSLLGLLGAWGLRRRKAKPVEVKGLRPRGEGRPVVAPQPNHNREAAVYGDANERHAGSQRRASSSSAAAAAAAAAAAVTGTAAVATSRGDKNADQDEPLTADAPEQAGTAEQTNGAVSSASPELTKQAPQVTTTPAPAATTPSQPVNTDTTSPAVESGSAEKSVESDSNVDAELEEKALDDTITEAEVYLRYGLHGQAEDLLKTAIERSPNNEEYHFKLLENYHDQKNGEDFNPLAEQFTAKFPNSAHKARIVEMAAEISGGVANNAGTGVGGTLAAGAAGAAAMATGAAANAKDAASDSFDSLTGSSFAGSADEPGSDLLDQTIDPGTEFSVDELNATGNLGALNDNEVDFSDHAELGHGNLGHGGLDQGGMSLDEVDLASLDDDGTMNLEEIAGSQMSGGDLGTLDLTNPVDNSFDNLSLEDTNFGDVTGDIGQNLGQNLDTDLSINNPVPGGTDEMETMLDLAKAYIDMGDSENASKALKDIAARGNPLQQTEAAELLKKIS